MTLEISQIRRTEISYLRRYKVPCIHVVCAKLFNRVADDWSRDDWSRMIGRGDDWSARIIGRGNYWSPFLCVKSAFDMFIYRSQMSYRLQKKRKQKIHGSVDYSRTWLHIYLAMWDTCLCRTVFLGTAKQPRYTVLIKSLRSPGFLLFLFSKYIKQWWYTACFMPKS